MAYSTFYGAGEAAERISHLASRQKPFLFVADFECNEFIIVEEPLHQTDVLFDIPSASNVNKGQFQTPYNKEFTFQPESFERYKRRFDIVEKGLHRGDSFLTNLTVKTPVQTDLSLKDIFMMTEARYSLYIPNRFVCFSPECFVTISADGRISTHPMKGTIDADILNAKDVILADKKESAEHATVVDLLRNDLSMFAEKVRVERYRYSTELQTDRAHILQISSEISGQLPQDWRQNLGLIITSMLPAGSVSGAPKPRTLQLIKEAEEEPRGFYSGVFGYFDGLSLDSGVIIRYIEQDKNGRKFYRSGGGITAMSDARSEYDEVIEKIYLPVRKPTFSEVICIIDGQPQHLPYHLKRMEKTIRDIYNKPMPQLQLDIPDEARKGLFKCRIEYDDTILSVVFSPYKQKVRKSIALVFDDNICYKYKSTDRRQLARLVQQAKTDDVIIVRNGMITDASYCNLVFEDFDGNLFTPSDALLHGTCRQRLIDDGVVKERPIRADELRRYKTVIFINAMMDICDAQRIAVGQIIGK
ncbi:MAG: aminodeoxychorismate synthase component I [Bacteroidaceae bacterium]|nr:aminodeoxychorismate synthase component I [Bacteroidaceae bacterium]